MQMYLWSQEMNFAPSCFNAYCHIPKKKHSYLPFVITEEDPVKFSIKNKTHILASRCIVSKLYKVKSNMYKKKIV